ncbi:hypothetical protein DMB42_05875 [Nonomuraea sp. WAC 01424]|nr:hypothetical protein DMB42_05875 [Nonomuraea sp. WAC 01424]
MRLKRQERLDDSDFNLSVIVSETVLCQHIGGAAVRAEQLRHLAEANRRRNVMVQVLPFRVGEHAALTGSFTILRFPGNANNMDIVYLENMTSAVYLEEAPEVHTYESVFDYLKASALSPNDSASMLMEVAERLA